MIYNRYILTLHGNCYNLLHFWRFWLRGADQHSHVWRYLATMPLNCMWWWLWWWWWRVLFPLC